jgi:hypothetical protein
MSATGSGFSYALQPAGVKNVLRVDSTELKTLILTTPASYTMLGILASSGSGGGHEDVVINYTDGSSDSFPGALGYDTSDWCDNGLRGAINGLGRANIGNYGQNFSYLHECNFGIYESFLTPDPTKQVVSISFHNQRAVYANIWAISGQ